MRPKVEFMGLALSPEAAFSTLASTREHDQITFAAAAPLPKALDWRKHNGKNWVTSIKDQGSCGSCVSFATCATLESRTLISKNKPGAKFDLSEAHLFYCGTPNSCGTGWFPDKALAFATRTGVGAEAAFPYTPGDQACRRIPAVVKATGKDTAGTTIARKQALQAGPVIACMAIYDDFNTYTSGTYRHIAGDLQGYHAICLVGYDDAKAHWICKNSWGPGWGMRGFFNIRYGECGIDSQFPFYFPTGVALQPGVKI
jgi:C1A family cysteine protease